jgi:tRNA dimethylallyltransferase
MNVHALSPLVAIVGPTAVGKTALSIALARQLGGEIVNADSRQIYRYMDIGTAKPMPDEQAAVPHHLIDIIAPDEPYSLAVYQEQALSAIERIAAQKHLPLLVGGTGQYAAAVLGWRPKPKHRERSHSTDGCERSIPRLPARSSQTTGGASSARWRSSRSPERRSRRSRPKLRRRIGS